MVKGNQWYSLNTYCCKCNIKCPIDAIRCPDCHNRVRHKKRGVNSPSLQKFKPTHTRSDPIVIHNAV